MGTSFDRDIALPGRFPKGTYKVWLADSTRAGRAVNLLFEPQP